MVLAAAELDLDLGASLALEKQPIDLRQTTCYFGNGIPALLRYFAPIERSL